MDAGVGEHEQDVQRLAVRAVLGEVGRSGVVADLIRDAFQGIVVRLAGQLAQPLRPHAPAETRELDALLNGVAELLRAADEGPQRNLEERGSGLVVALLRGAGQGVRHQIGRQSGARRTAFQEVQIQLALVAQQVRPDRVSGPHQQIPDEREEIDGVLLDPVLGHDAHAGGVLEDVDDLEPGVETRGTRPER